ncbi:MAG: LysR family transcriptional regulator, partial [Clostridiales bacterium]
MEIKRLAYFIVMAESGQITAAAQKLHLAQPPLSRELQKLEQELGVTLFNRNSKGIELTPCGQALYEKAKKLLDDYREMVDFVRETAQGICGTIRIGANFSTIPLFADKIHLLSQRYPLLEFKIIQDSHGALMEQLKSGLLDVIFLSMPTLEHHDFSFLTLADDPLVLVVNQDLDPAPGCDSLTIEQLRDIPLVMMQTGDFYGYNEILIAECQKHHFTPNIICQCNSPSAAITLVEKGVGLSYQSQMLTDSLQNPHIYAKH